MQSIEHVAAIDLGSNSFHMIVSRLVQGEPIVLDRIRTQVQLAAGIQEDGSLSHAATERALACLRRFGQRLSNEERLLVRAVGTNTLRVAADSAGFLDRACEALGHPIEVIAGREEARLIYLGVSHSNPLEEGRRLVVDIGGGSTECIIGEGFEPLDVHSLYMGCVSWSRRFLKDGRKITRKTMKRAVLAARVELEPIEREFRRRGWTDAIGASGTIKAANSVVQANEWGEVLDRDSLERLEEAILDAGSSDNLELKGLKPERADVFAGGVAILRALFDSLRIERMDVSTGALREGVIYDLLGRIRHEDVRERTIASFQERFHVDMKQAERVEEAVMAAWNQVKSDWDLKNDGAPMFLSWAARLHEIGLSISYRQHHRHAGYLLANADMPGFSRDDQLMLATLVNGQRRSPESRWDDEMPERSRQRAAKLRVLLRLAVLLVRSRDRRNTLVCRFQARKKSLVLHTTAADLEAAPLTALDLEEEIARLSGTDIELELKTD